MSKHDGRRDLSLIRASGSTARVLNLLLVAERFGDTPEYQEKPLFKSKRLNKTLIVKHAVRPHERELFRRPPVAATKIIVPFASDQLELGGASILVNEERFERLVRDTFGYTSEADFVADVELLRLLAGLPSFDPFLMRERLRHNGYQPARCYFDIAEADVARMRAFVGKEISQLINLAFATGGHDAGDLSNKMADKLMTDETAKSLDPLRQVLRLSGEEYVEGIFAWKGFLYYKWLMAELKPQLAAFKPRFAACRVVRATLEERTDLAQMRKGILEQMASAANQVDECLLEYGAAFASLSEGQTGAFRSFLLKAPSMFIPIGEAVGVVRHIHSFWNFRFPEAAAVPTLEGDEAMETFNDFEATLSGVEFVRKAAAAAEAA